MIDRRRFLSVSVGSLAATALRGALPAGAAPAAARPAAAPPASSASRPPASNLANSFLGDDDEGATRVNPIPEPARAAPPAAAKPAAAPAKPATAARPAVSITAAKPQARPQETSDRTVVMSTGTALPPPAGGDDDVDFSSIVDNLGEG